LIHISVSIEKFTLKTLRNETTNTI